MATLFEQTWFIWSLGLAIGFPLLVILLGELEHTLNRRENPLAAPIRNLRNLVLPVLVSLLFVNFVLGIQDGSAIKIFATLFWTVAIYSALSLLNAALFLGAKEGSWRANVPTLFLDLSRFILILVGVAIVLSTVWDADLGGLLTALGVGSIVIGLALQDTLSNIFAGISILFERPYSEGDWIEVAGTVGKVTAINWRATRIQTRDGDMVVIPNGVMATETILNESRPAGPGYEEYIVGFSYDDPPNKVKDIMLETIRATHGVLTEPKPLVRTLSYDDSSISYQVRFAIEDFADLPTIKDDFASRIWYAAQRYGLNIPFPIRTVFHYDGQQLDNAKLEQDSATKLSQVKDILLSDASVDELSTGVSVKHFGAGEIIIQVGERVHELYSVVSGEVCMAILDKQSDAMHQVTCLDKGDLFGAASLFRNEPSSSQFKALSDVELIALSADTVMQMVERKPSFAREMEDLIEARYQAEKVFKLNLQSA